MKSSSFSISTSRFVFSLLGELMKVDSLPTVDELLNCLSANNKHRNEDLEKLFDPKIFENLCDRHNTLVNMISGNVACQNEEFHTLDRQLYIGGMPYLNCDS